MNCRTRGKNDFNRARFSRGVDFVPREAGQDRSESKLTKSARQQDRAVSNIAMDGAPQVDAYPVGDLTRLEPYWRDLGLRAGDPNPFGESAFLASATRHVAPRGLAALCVWESSGRARLDALALIRPARTPFAIVDVWRSELAPLPALLVDAGKAIASLEAMVGWMARERPAAVALGLSNVDVNGAFAQGLRAIAAKDGLRLEASNVRQRAALDCGPGANFVATLDAKRRKEWRRLRRRLEDRGNLEFSWSQEPAAIEDFLALEASGWKGARGTAMTADANRAAFAREMLHTFASRGRLRIARLTLDRRTIAAGVVLLSGSRAYYWKTAFDENFGEFSPGVQLTLAMSRDLESDGKLSLADSCADANHPMIDRLWTARIDVADFTLAAKPGANVAFSLALAARQAKTAARERIKGLIARRRR
jgi:CelD/BcsL family acetyltransferase involved in cellulose biosynthesis